VGVSMGGGIAQDLAVQHPERVLSLTLIATSTAFDRADDSPLPSPEARVAATFEPSRNDDRDWADQDAVVDGMVEALRPFSGSLGLDEERVRAISRRVVERTPDMQASLTNHWIVVGGGDGEPHTMAEIEAPTLVLHGTADPLFPLAHGRALASEIRGARLVPLEGMGHEVPPRALWDVVIPEIVDHTA